MIKVYIDYDGLPEMEETHQVMFNENDEEIDPSEIEGLKFTGFELKERKNSSSIILLIFE